MDVSQNRGAPKWMVKIMENPIEMDALGVNKPIFGSTPKSSSTISSSNLKTQAATSRPRGPIGGPRATPVLHPFIWRPFIRAELVRPPCLQKIGSKGESPTFFAYFLGLMMQISSSLFQDGTR